MAIIQIHLSGRPGDSPEVPAKTIYTENINTDAPLAVAGAVDRAVRAFTKDQELGTGFYDLVRYDHRLTADLYDFIDSIHEGYGERSTFRREYTDSYAHITTLALYAE